MYQPGPFYWPKSPKPTALHVVDSPHELPMSAGGAEPGARDADDGGRLAAGAARRGGKGRGLSLPVPHRLADSF